MTHQAHMNCPATIHPESSLKRILILTQYFFSRFEAEKESPQLIDDGYRVKMNYFFIHGDGLVCSLLLEFPALFLLQEEATHPALQSHSDPTLSTI